MDKKIKHLEMIQNVITRMANNSFRLKGWAVTIVAGIFVLANRSTDIQYFFVTFIPIIFFWVLDSYYLQQERLYRDLYDKVRFTNEEDIDFSLKASVKEFGATDKKTRLKNCLFSKTEVIFYLPLAAVCVVIIIITLCLK